MDYEAGMERALRARGAAPWRKWREVASLLVKKSIPLKSKCMKQNRSVMLYITKTWAKTGIDDILKEV